MDERAEMFRTEQYSGGGGLRPYESLPRPVIKPGFGFERPYEGDTNDWLTPPKLVRMLGEFDLDPCGCPNQPWQLAKLTYAPPQNGLTLPWFGRVFCNPPYGPNVKEWVQRMAEHRNGILLIFSRTETKAWQYVWDTGDAFLFPVGRVSFYRPNGKRAKSGTAPSALIAYGTNNAYTLHNCGIRGAFFPKVKMVGTVNASSL